MTYLTAIIAYLQGIQWTDIALSLQWLFLGYFICINAAYLTLNYISVFSILSLRH